jgi:methyl-accepting chemotaxis protein
MMKLTGRRPLRIKWMVLISAAVFVSLLGSTLMLFTTVRNSLYDTFANGNAVQVESATREMRMLSEQYEKSVEQLSRDIAILGRHSQDADTAIDLMLKETLAKDPTVLGAYFMSASSGKMHIAPYVNYAIDARETPTYKLALQNKETSWTDVHQNETTKKMILSVVTPVMVDNQLFGVVGYDIDLNGIGALRESNEMFGKNKLVIYDNQGLIVTSFMQGMEGKNIDPSASGKVAGAQDIVEDPAKMKQQFGWITDIAKGRTQGIKFKWDGVQYRGEVSFVYSMNWNVVSFADNQALNSSLFGFLRTSILAMVIGLAIGAIAAYYIATQVLKIINALRSTIAKTADGDLVTEFEYGNNDEIGDLAKSYNAMLGSIRTLIQRVNFSVMAVEKTANGVRRISGENVITGLEVARSTEEIALGAANTSSEVEKSSVAVHQLSQEIGTLIEQSNEIGLVLADSNHLVQFGNTQVEHLESSYIQLEQEFKQVTTLVADLNEKSQSISAVTKSISDIAEQTNVLSINASIEASRAGEHGRGFAVVANEVRNLAEQSRRSAKQIQQTISVILSQTNNLVRVVDNTNSVNHTQKSAVSQVSQAMKQMNESLGNVRVKVQGELATISSIEEQKGVVVASIENILAVSEQTTASTQEIASSVEQQTSSITEVSDHANQLVELVGELKSSVSKFKVEE